MLEFEFSSHGAGMIHAYRWEPEGQPRGVVQIIHGIAEYVPRYAGFAAFLNARGFLVTGEDHMGHGKSHGTEPCHFSGGWCAAVDDSMELLRRTQRDYPVPVFCRGFVGTLQGRGQPGPAAHLQPVQGNDKTYQPIASVAALIERLVGDNSTAEGHWCTTAPA